MGVYGGGGLSPASPGTSSTTTADARAPVCPDIISRGTTGNMRITRLVAGSVTAGLIGLTPIAIAAPAKRITRLVAGAVTAGLVGVTPIAISAPAHADGQTYTPIVTAQLNISNSPYDPPYMFGGGFYVSGSVTDPTEFTTATAPRTWPTCRSTPRRTRCGPRSPPTTRRASSSSTVTSPSPRMPSTRLSFTAADRINPPTRTPTSPASPSRSSAPVTRKVVFKNPKGTLIKGKVTPNYGKKKIKVAKKVGKKWKKFKTYKTTSAGKYRFKPAGPAPRQDAVPHHRPGQRPVHQVGDQGLHLQLAHPGRSQGRLHALTLD